jgi:amino acid adenylation domain-containing protein
MSKFLGRLEHSFLAHADKPALVDGPHIWTYRELDTASRAVIGHLQGHGMAAGAVVPVAMRRSGLQVITLLALVRMGCAYAPIDLSSGASRRQWIRAQLGGLACLVDESSQEASDPGSLALGSQHLMGAPGAPASVDTVLDDALQYIMFTSGSTGRPKGVMVPQRAVHRLVVGQGAYEVKTGQRWAHMSSPAFDASTLEVWAPLLNGGVCVVQPLELPSLQELSSFLLGQGVTDAWLTAALFNTVMDHQPQCLRGLAQLLIGGERLSPTHVRRFLEHHPHARLYNGYGPTENTTFTLCHLITPADTHRPQGIPLGHALDGTQVRLDTDSEGDVGELLTAGEGLSLGYWQDSDRTAEKFIETDGTLWYRTGDQVQRQPDGSFDYLGRFDRQIKLQGHRIELDEVETALLALPGVQTAAIVVHGELAQDRQLVAFVTCEAAEPPLTQWRQQLGDGLPAAAVPQLIRVLPSMPLNVNGKIDRTALEQLLADERTPDASTELAERSILAIVQQVLRLASVQESDNFRALGGTSLQAMRVAQCVREVFQVELNPLEVMRLPDLAALTRFVAQCPSTQWSADGEGPGKLRLSSGQRFLLAAQLFKPEAADAYLVHLPVLLPAALKAGKLRQVMEVLAFRHPALRLRLNEPGLARTASWGEQPAPGWWQEHFDTQADGLSPGAPWPDGWLPRALAPMDAGQGVFRCHLFRGRQQQVLLLTFHHIVVDDASLDRLFGEFWRLLDGQTLPPVFGSPVSLAAFEARLVTEREAIEAVADAAEKRVGAAQAPRPAPPAPGKTKSVKVPPTLAQQVLALSAQLGGGASVLCLQAYGLALQAVLGHAHSQVLVPVSKRLDLEVMEPVGYLLDLRLLDLEHQHRAPLEQWQHLNETMHRAMSASQQPLHELAQALTRRSGELGDWLMAHGYTWRDQPLPHAQAKGLALQVLEAPVKHARFHWCLHVSPDTSTGLRASIEYIDSPQADEKATRLAGQWLDALQHICDSLKVELASRHAAAAQEVALAVPDWLDRLWCRTLGTDRATPSSHFLEEGGTSIKAMRLCAQVQADTGKAVSVAAFMRNPRLGRLNEMLQGQAQEPGRGLPCWQLFGPPNAQRFLLMLPGIGGAALGMLALAEAFLTLLPGDCAVAVIELQDLVARAPETDVVWFLERHIEQLLGQLGRDKVMAVVGFSATGLLAIRVAQSLSAHGQDEPALACLIDTYAPGVNPKSVVQATMDTLVKGWQKSLGTTAPAPGAQYGLSEGRALERSKQSRPDPLWSELDAQPVKAPGVRVHLVQADAAVKDVGLLFKRASNGFDTRQFAGWQSSMLDSTHLGLVSEHALLTARTLMGGWLARKAKG